MIGKKIKEDEIAKKNNNLVLKIISNKINSNQKSTNRVWHIKKLKVGEVEKNQIL